MGTTAAQFSPLDSGGIFPGWSTPLIADACLRLKVPLRVAPAGLRPIAVGQRVGGRVRPVRHHGSVDVFLEALEQAAPGEVLVIDNGGRRDEACIGDLTVLEARAAGLAGVVLWGLHRDSPELRRIAWPVFSYGTIPAGPQRLDRHEPETFTRARFGAGETSADDFVFADDDGAVFVPVASLSEIVRTAQGIGETESRQADAARAGQSLRVQLRFGEYLEKRRLKPNLTFREYLREIRGAIEE